jgi:hypothetical protein
MNLHSTSNTSRPRGTPATILAKSAVCVAVVVGVAWIGFASLGGEAGTDPSINETGAAAGAATGVVIHGDRAAAHRRQVFDERRARFEARTPAQVAGATQIEYPMP